MVWSVLGASFGRVGSMGKPNRESKLQLRKVPSSYLEGVWVADGSNLAEAAGGFDFL